MWMDFFSFSFPFLPPLKLNNSIISYIHGFKHPLLLLLVFFLITTSILFQWLMMMINIWCVYIFATVFSLQHWKKIWNVRMICVCVCVQVSVAGSFQRKKERKKISSSFLQLNEWIGSKETIRIIKKYHSIFFHWPSLT